jgi:hypothetical protein
MCQLLVASPLGSDRLKTVIMLCHAVLCCAAIRNALADQMWSDDHCMMIIASL